MESVSEENQTYGRVDEATSHEEEDAQTGDCSVVPGEGIGNIVARERVEGGSGADPVAGKSRIEGDREEIEELVADYLDGVEDSCLEDMIGKEWRPDLEEDKYKKDTDYSRFRCSGGTETIMFEGI